MKLLGQGCERQSINLIYFYRRGNCCDKFKAIQFFLAISHEEANEYKVIHLVKWEFCLSFGMLEASDWRFEGYSAFRKGRAPLDLLLGEPSHVNSN